MKETKAKGITLIALIITIIVLLLIAGITISILMGDHGILRQAKNAKVTSIEARVDEEIELAIQTANMAIRRQTATNNSWDARTEEGIEEVKKTLETDLVKEKGYTITVLESEAGAETRIIEIEYAGEDYQKAKGDENAKRTKDIEVSQSGVAITTCRHTWDAGQITKEATCAEVGIKTYTCAKCGETKTERIAKLAHTYNASGVCTVCGAEKQELVIGANINYHEYIGEDGNTLSTMPSYESKSTTNGDVDATYTVKAPAENETPMQWIVLGEENGQIKITTKNIVEPSSGGYTSGSFKYLRFSGQNGYENFVNELNKISAIYGKGKYADTSKFTVEGVGTGGRSFIMEDLGYGELTRTAGYTYARHSDGKIYRYEAGAEVDGTSTTGGSYSKFEYMDLDASTSTEEGQHTWKELTADNPSVTIYNYTYSGKQTLPTTVSKADTSYWLASRYVRYYAGYVNFAARFVASGGSYVNCYLYLSSGSSTYAGYGVRPVVYLKSDIQLTYDATNGYTIGEAE